MLWRDFPSNINRNSVVKLQSKGLLSTSFLVSRLWFLALGNTVFWCAPLPPTFRGFALKVMLLLAVPGHAYMYHTTGKKEPFKARRTVVFQHTAPQKTPQWNFPTLLESITHEKSVCLLLLHGKLELHSMTPFSSESGTDTHR